MRRTTSLLSKPLPTYLLVALILLLPSASALALGIAVCVGVNEVDPDHYGDPMPLANCENDARAMQSIAVSQGFDSELILTQQATRAELISRIRAASSRLKAGSIFMLSFAGHGGFLPDDDKEEQDGYDETWCLYDAQFIDDELFTELSRFEEGVRVLVISDSCHSGTITRMILDAQAENARGVQDDAFAEAYAEFRKSKTTDELRVRALPPTESLRIYEKHREFYHASRRGTSDELSTELRASVLSLVACKDDELAADGSENNGVFTTAVITVWDGGEFEGDYPAFHKAVRDAALRLNHFQHAVYVIRPVSDPPFENQSPFTVAAP